MSEWYFAYGSNLLASQMTARTGLVLAGVPAPRRAVLPGHRLTFDVPGEAGQAFANVTPGGPGVLGVLYRCGPGVLARLDAYERGYDRRSVRVVPEDGSPLEAFVYVAGPAGLAEGRRPTAEYLGRVVTGARQHGLPEDYIRGIEALAAGT